jgi:hypothetical protein
VYPALLALFGASGALASVDFDHAAFARAEVAAGVAPVVPNGESVPSFSSELSPGYAMRGLGPRLTLGFRGGPRFQYLWPLMRGIRRPLVLGQAEAGLEYRLSERWTTAISTTQAYGEVDYSQARLTLRTPLASNLDQPILTAYQGEGRVGLTWLASTRSSLETTAQVGYSRPLSAMTRRELATTTRIGGRMGYRYELDPSSSVGITADASHYFVADRPETVARNPDQDADSTQISGILGYRRSFNLRTSMDASGGITVTALWPGETALLPNARVSLERVLHQLGGVRVVNGISASVEAVYDPTLAVLYPLAGLEASLSSEFTERWRLVFLLGAFAAATAGPLSETASTSAAADAAESRLSASLTVAHDLASWLDVSFGYRLSADGSHVATSPYEIRNRQAWVFLALSAAFGDAGTRADGRWVR